MIFREEQRPDQHPSRSVLHYLGKQLQVLVHIVGDGGSDGLLFFKVCFFEGIEHFILFVHGHELLVGAVTGQVFLVGIVNLTGLVNELGELTIK